MIHDRYRQRLHAYSRQMLAGSVCRRRGCGAGDLRTRLRRGYVATIVSWRSAPGFTESPTTAVSTRFGGRRPIATEAIEELTVDAGPDMARVEQRDALRRLIADVRRLPEQQRSALLMRELGGMAYAEVAEALGVSVPAVKSLLVRARVGLAQAGGRPGTLRARDPRGSDRLPRSGGAGAAGWPAVTFVTAPIAGGSAPRSAASAPAGRPGAGARAGRGDRQAAGGGPEAVARPPGRRDATSGAARRNRCVRLRRRRHRRCRSRGDVARRRGGDRRGRDRAAAALSPGQPRRAPSHRQGGFGADQAR